MPSSFWKHFIVKLHGFLQSFLLCFIWPTWIWNQDGGKMKSGQWQVECDFSSAAACSCYRHFESHFHNIWACDGCSPCSQTSGRWCRATTDLIETELVPADGSSPYFTETWNKKKKGTKHFKIVCVLSLHLQQFWLCPENSILLKRVVLPIDKKKNKSNTTLQLRPFTTRC